MTCDSTPTAAQKASARPANFRRWAQLTQDETVRRMRARGARLSRSRLSTLENGAGEWPNLGWINTLADVYGCTLADLCTAVARARQDAERSVA